MGMFSIPVKFKCKSCKSIFEYVDQFIGHKKENHFKEFQNLKCILFEEKTETTTTEGHRDGEQEFPTEGSSLLTKSSPVRQEELIITNSGSAGIAGNNAEIEQASSWGHQNLILYTSDDNTADSYSINLLNAENIIHQVDNNETDPVADSIKQETELEIEIELDADSESQFDCFLDEQSNSSSHEEFAETDVTPLSSVDKKENTCNTFFHYLTNPTSANENETNLLVPIPYVRITRLTSSEIRRATASSSNLNIINCIAASVKRETAGQTVRKNIRRTKTISTSSTNKNKSFSCDLCDATFSQKGNLSNHLLTHSDLRPFKCNFQNCTSSFKAKRNLDQHQVSHSEERPFHCKFPGCNKSSKSRESFRSHVRTHKEVRSYVCNHPHCGRVFRLADSLEQHISTFHGQINESSTIMDSATNSYTCDICSSEFPSKSHLNRHLAVHSDLKPFKCEFPSCPSRFRLKRSLDQHELSHSDLRPFKCTYPGCSKACKYSQNIRKHMRTHTDDRPYKCSIVHCDRTFRHPESVKAHVVACHSGDEGAQRLLLAAKYACDIKGCTKKFYKKQAYDKHYRAHKREVDSLLKCPHAECNSDFTRAELILHMRRVHKGQKRLSSSNPLPPHVILVQSAASPPVSVSVSE